MYQIPLDNINFRPLDIWGLGVAAITDFLYYDPDPQYVDNASITNRGTSGTNAVGYSGKSYDCDGVSDFVDTGQTLDIDYNDSFDFSVWVKLDQIKTSVIAGNLQATSPLRGLEISITATGEVRIFFGNSISNYIDINTTDSLVINKWYLIGVSYTGNGLASGFTVSFDGVNQTLDTPVRDDLSSLTTISTRNLEFGYRGYNSALFFNGQISDCPITINGTLVHYFEFNQASATGIFDSVQGVLATNSGCALIEGLSGLENGETHNGIPQSFSKNWNRYSSTSLTGTTSLSGTALTGSGTTFTTELAANDIVRVAGNIARVTSVTDNTNAVVVNITSGSWSAQSTVRLRLGGSDQLLPEDANNAGFDVGGLAIVDAQPKFKLDGASYLEGEVLTIDYNTAFEIEFDVVFYELGNSEILAENLDGSTSFRGLQITKNASDLISIFFCNNNATTTYLLFTSTTVVAANTTYSIKVTHDGTGVSSGFDLLINDVSETKIVNQNSLGGNTTVTTNPLNIGRRQSTDTLQLNGSITNFKFNYL